ncbi:MAG TPA: nucleotidyl transferase AbiEii/AbiGii toxin family protein [Terracidiphilus sp.]
MSKFDPHWDVLPPAQRALWPQLSASAELGFVLYGGTAAALRLGHRTSLDFDFFTEKPLDREALKNGFPFLMRSTVLQDRKDTLSVLAPVGDSEVKTSFFGEIDIGRTGKPDRTGDGVAEVASLLDLLATKLKVIQQRIESKDYIDVAAILRAGIALEDGLAAATALFAPDFQPSEAVRALTYFEGGDLASLPRADGELLIQASGHLRHIPAAIRRSSSLSARE